MAVGKKIVFIVSDTGARDKVVAYFWYARHFKQRNYRVYFIILDGNYALREFLNTEGIPYIVLNYTGKSKWDLVSATFKTWCFLLIRRPQVVHTHYFDANLIGLVAAKLAFVRRRIYSRHHGSLAHMLIGGITFYDKIMNWCANKIVAVSENVKTILIEMEGVDGRKIEVIHHGFDFNEIENFDQTRVKAIKEKYKFPSGKKIIGVVSTYHKMKGVDYIIKAFKKCLEQRSDIFLVIANAHGADEQEIKELLGSIPSDSYCEIVYENDIFALFYAFSIFVHAPIDARLEAFGQVYIEALACRVPSVFTMSGIAPEFIENGKNALVVDFENAGQIENAILNLLSNEQLRLSISEKGYLDVRSLFEVNKMIDKMEELYFP